MTDDYDGQGNGDGGKCGPGVTALDSRAMQRAMQDIGPLARELRATMKTIAESWKPPIGSTSWMTTALGGDHRAVSKVLQDISGVTSAAGPGSVFRQLMRDAESSVGASIKSSVESWRPPIGIAPSMTAALGGDHRSVFKALQDVSGLASAAERGSVFRQLMRDAQPPGMASIKSITESWKPPIGSTSWMTTALGGDHRAVSKVLQDISGVTSAAGPGSVFRQLMPDAESSVGASIKSSVENWKPPIGSTSWMTTALAGSIESITDQMRSWSKLAESGYRIARLALRMALAAQDAVKRGDREAVKQFMLGWLGFKKVSWDLVNSASLVLLDSRRWLPDGESVLDRDPTPTLRKLTLEEHRRCSRLLTDPNLQVHGKPMLSLNMPVTADDPHYTLLDSLADKPQGDVFGEDGINDPRVLRVLAKLTQHERHIVTERGHAGTTWADAAVACGGIPDEGESLRRKVKRLGKSAGDNSACCGQPDTADDWSLPTGAVG